MLDQLTFDRSEDIAEALHEAQGLRNALISVLSDRLSPEDEHVVFALIAAQGYCLTRAVRVARHIAKSGGQA